MICVGAVVLASRWGKWKPEFCIQLPVLARDKEYDGAKKAAVRLGPIVTAEDIVISNTRALVNNKSAFRS